MHPPSLSAHIITTRRRLPDLLADRRPVSSLLNVANREAGEGAVAVVLWKKPPADLSSGETLRSFDPL